MFVSAAPSLRPLDLIQPAHADGQFPSLTDDRTRFFSRGCGALETLLRGIGLAPGQGVLAPTYLCGEVVQVFAAASVPVTYYAIDSRGGFDPDEIARKITPATRAVYVVHYFGFPMHLERMRLLADDAGVMLIEDCAHALFGRVRNRWLGEFGDAAVFSLRKTLPLPDGGALVVNNARLIAAPAARRTPPADTARRTARLLAKSLVFQLQWRPRLTPPADPVAAGVSSTPTAAEEMSGTARRLYSRADVAAHTERRRANFRFYLSKLRDVALYDELPDGVVPFSFPVVLDRRDDVARELARRGLSLNAGFPEAPVMMGSPAGDADLSGARSLAHRVLELPVHQDLSPGHLDYVIDLYNEVR